MHRILRLSLTLVVLGSSLALAGGLLSSLSSATLTVENDLLEDAAGTAGVGEVGDALYDAQEGAHDAVTDATGVAIPHDYASVCVGDECVPVDPFLVNN